MKFFTRLSFLYLLLSNVMTLNAQTVGLFHNDSTSYNGYTLFSSYAGDTTYLIDNCGRLVHKWQSAVPAARTPVHLLPSGSLIRSAKSSSTIFPGGGAGAFEMLDWNSNVLWSYDVTDTTQTAHHDYRVMPNGNILVVLWEIRTAAEFIANGGNPANASSSFWPDKIQELKPIGSDSAVVVWEWKAWDHMIQEFDANKNNYGPVAAHPELLDINVIPPGSGSWLHTNGVDYNPALDQILISVRNLSEIWIIDHSTTTAEAATHTGGNSGMGGDILYRWGNPANYKRGTAADQKLFQQHDAQWVKPGFPNASKISIFNNGLGRPQGSFSSVEIIRPPVSLTNTYFIAPGQAYGPTSPDWVYPSTLNSSFYSSTMGGATVQPNGNILICEANSGELIEVDTAAAEVWRYVSPVSVGGIITQGSTGNNGVFKFNRYPPEYAGFTGQTLTPGLPIEINPLPSNCTIYLPPVTAVDDISVADADQLVVYPNPAQAIANISITTDRAGTWTIDLCEISGRILNTNLHSALKGTNKFQINLNDLPNGVYLVNARSGSSRNQALLVVN
jgi:hypothetical protein